MQLQARRKKPRQKDNPRIRGADPFVDGMALLNHNRTESKSTSWSGIRKAISFWVQAIGGGDHLGGTVSRFVVWGHVALSHGSYEALSFLQQMSTRK